MNIENSLTLLSYRHWVIVILCVFGIYTVFSCDTNSHHLELYGIRKALSVRVRAPLTILVYSRQNHINPAYTLVVSNE